MTETSSKPFRRGLSKMLRVQGLDGFGEPVTLEVQSEEWLHARAGRYRRVWPRPPRRAARVGDAPGWLREAVHKAAKLR